ncbi:MAG: GTPase Era [Actinomycetota bacterium]|nr:GTPase Era [Actinomycetota bacterium]
MTDSPYRSGFVSITGRPNVGKSTLLNTMLGQKISIVTSKPQTTRNRITGIKTLPGAQIVFIDSPGIHNPVSRYGDMMVREAREAVSGVDIVLLVVNPVVPGPRDLEIIKFLGKAAKSVPVFLVVNKVDSVSKPKLLPVIDEYSKAFEFAEVIPISALKGDGVELLLEKIASRLPEGPMQYPDDMVTDRLERFMVSEIIREKVMELTEQEVPHSVAVDVVVWEESPAGHEGKGLDNPRGRVRIGADIWVERDSQKGIIIGKGGQRLKSIGTSARAEIEKLLDSRVHLDLWVKLKKDWRYDLKAIRELGI